MRIKTGNDLSDDAATLDFGSGWSQTRSGDGREVQVSSGGSITYAHAPTGTVSVDKAVLADAVADTADGGVIVLANGGDTPYATDTAWVINKSLSVEGAGTPILLGYDGGTPLTSPFIKGPVILQTAAGLNGIEVQVTGKTVNLRRLAVRFDNPGTVAFSNTGHGIFVQSSAVFDTGHDISLVDALWEDVWVFGHDGNHYARVIVNGLCNTFVNMRSAGGGIVRYVQDSDRIVSGNTVDIHPFGQMFCAGTAHGFAFAPFAAAGAGGGPLNLFTFVRPQVNMVDYSGRTAFGSPTKPTVSQYMWQAQDGSFEVVNVGVIDPDLEADDSVAHPVNFGSAASGNIVRAGGAVLTSGVVTNLAQEIVGTVTATGLGIGPSALAALTTGQKSLALGKNALAANTTGSNNTGLGYGTLAANVSGINCTAVGQGALAAATANANTAVGSSALAALTTGTNNVAVGDSALALSTASASCTAVGSSALASFNSASTGNNTAVGKEAFTSLTTGHDNTAVGYQAGKTETAANATTTASFQTILGDQAGLSSSTQVNEIVAVGYRAKAGAAGAIAVGSQAQATGSAAVAIGQLVTTSVANQIALGSASHHILLKTVAAPADASLAASQFTLWLTDTPSGAKLNVKAKDSAGTVVTGTVSLA